MKEAEARNNPVPPAASSALSSTSASTAKQDSAAPSVDFDSLKSISDLGIDVSFLDHFKQADRMQNELDKNADKITELNKLQSDRLSMHPASIDKVKAIPDKEKTAAGEIITQLASLAGEATPGDLTDNSKLRQSIGVGPVPVTSQPGPLSVTVDKVLTENESKDGENITHADALVHSVPLGESPSDN